MIGSWKIFYTNGTSVKWDDPQISEDVRNIQKRRGVHSVVQAFDQGRSRQTIHHYHYLYLLTEGQWAGCTFIELKDKLHSDFNNIGCVLNGMTMPTSNFYRMIQTVRMDTDIIGWITPEMEQETRNYAFSHARAYKSEVALAEGIDKSRFQDWTEPSREGPYPGSAVEKPYYGEPKFFQNQETP